MRQVVYFHGGAVADFPIPDAVYTAFAERFQARPDPLEALETARRILERVMLCHAEGKEASMAEAEILAACHIWHHFNTAPEDSRIDGDVIVIDPDGDGEEITYSPLADVELRAEGS